MTQVLNQVNKRLKVPQVIYVQNSVHLAGAQKSLSRILAAKASRGLDPILVTSKSGWLTSFASQHGIYVLTKPFPKSRSLKARLFHNRIFAKRLVGELRKRLPRNCSALVHANDHPDSLIAYDLARALGLPSVLTLRSSQMRKRDFFKYGCGEHNAIISVGDDLYQKATFWMPKARNYLVYNGLSDDEFYAPVAPAGKVVDKVLVLGSMNPLKGWKDLVEALLMIEQRSLCSERPKIVFLGGHGDQKSQNEVGTNRLLQFETQFIPPVTDFSELIRQFPLVIHPSRSESFGMAAMETVAAGVPLLAASTGMIPSFIDNEKFLFSPSDVTTLSSRMAEFFSQTDSSLQALFRISERQTYLSQNYSTNTTLQSLMSIYRQVVSD